MDKKEISVFLENEGGKYILVFQLSKTKCIDLYSDDTDQIKKLYIGILEELINYDIQFNFKIGDSIEPNDNSLPVNVGRDYVAQLNNDLDELKTNEHLIEIRKLQ